MARTLYSRVVPDHWHREPALINSRRRGQKTIGRRFQLRRFHQLRRLRRCKHARSVHARWWRPNVWRHRLWRPSFRRLQLLGLVLRLDEGWCRVWWHHIIWCRRRNWRQTSNDGLRWLSRRSHGPYRRYRFLVFYDGVFGSFRARQDFIFSLSLLRFGASVDADSGSLISTLSMEVRAGSFGLSASSVF